MEIFVKRILIFVKKFLVSLQPHFKRRNRKEKYGKNESVVCDAGDHSLS
jgi:hypothetical protein